MTVRAHQLELLAEPSKGTEAVWHSLDGSGIAKVRPSPYFFNGPSDQPPFLSRLIQMQLASPLLRPRDAEAYFDRLAAVSQVELAGERVIPAAHRLERSRAIDRHWNVNYYSHGWHRYVGRFPPQLVRAVLNYFGATPETVVLDPFAGSGTTAVECRLLGIPFIGIEICPLSALLCRAKSYGGYSVEALDHALAWFSGQYDALLSPTSLSLTTESVLALPWNPIPRFPNVDRWFTPAALLGVAAAVHVAEQAHSEWLRDLLCVAISASMRSIGNVDVDVVRAEYSRKPRINVNAKQVILGKLQSYRDAVRSVIHEGVYPRACSVQTICGDMRETSLPPESVDFIITSPPYGVESISYLRTHLLSYRCLYPQQDPYQFGSKVIGSEYLEETPDGTIRLRGEMARTFFFKRLAASSGLHHRRLIQMAKFFVDMETVVQQFASWVRRGGRVCFIIGNKKIGQTIIPADEMVIELFALHGFTLVDKISHKLKSNNTNSQTPWEERAINEEHILFFLRSP